MEAKKQIWGVGENMGTEESKKIWEENAQFWDNAMGDECYSTIATPCTHELTFTQETPREVDDDGHVLYPGGIEAIVKDMPCVVTHTPALSNAQGTPGLVMNDMMTVMTQHNMHTEAIQIGAQAVVDHQTYRVVDLAIDGSGDGSEAECGLLTLIMERMAGGRQ